jgi:hypothetical protein
VRDADGRTDSRKLGMTVTDKLPPPDVTAIAPTFGWPGLAPAAPQPTEVLITGTGFDSRVAGNTTVRIGPGAGVVAKVLEATSSKLRVEVPKGATPGPIVVKTGFGQASSTATFVAHPDGYRFVDGFPFVNTVEDDDATDGFPDNFSWETFEQTFGVCSMWMCALGVGTLPDPISTLLFLGLNDQLDSGCCHGFALTSLQLKKGIIPSSPYPVTGAGPPLAETLFDSAEPNRPSPALSQTIQSRQLVTFSDEALGFYLNKWDVVPGVNGNFCVMDARPELAEMQAALGSGLADPPMLAFAKNCSPFDGHVVVPYAVETAGSAKRIRAYDPNLPGTPAALADSAKSVFTVNPATGVWSYPFSDGTTWGGTFMFNIPL